MIIPLNNDDDDENEIPDNQQETGEIEYEDDLIPLVIRQPAGISDGTLILKFEAGSHLVRMWENQERDEGGPLLGQGSGHTQATWDISEMTEDVTVWLEGVAGSPNRGDIRLVLAQSAPSSNPATAPVVDRIVAQAASAAIVPTAGQESKGGLVQSNKGAAGFGHYVTPRVTGVPGPGGYVELEAKNLPAGTLVGSDQVYRWKLNGEFNNGAMGSPGKIQISRGEEGKYVVELWDTVKGQVVRTMIVWVIWTSQATSVGSLNTVSNANIYGKKLSSQNTVFNILPSSILDTNADIPDLSGPNESDAPISGLAGNTFFHIDKKNSVSNKWDVSRQMRNKLINVPNFNFNVARYFSLDGFLGLANYLDWPSSDATGNDDTHTADEDNNPYQAPYLGSLRAEDTPGEFLYHADMANGDKIELRIQFRDFARVEIEKRWYRISDYADWRVNYKWEKVNGLWQDDGSSAAADHDNWD